MLRLSRLNSALVTGGAITHAATTLNELLDITHGKTPVPRDELKTFMKESVMPVLAGTELDRRGNSTELRQYLGQLTRDAAFAASILRARPDAGFMQSMITCIKEDHTRMRFVAKMTSAQASKTIEYLCKVGVSDEGVFPVLISRLDYANLQEIGRVAFALADAGLDELNMLVVVPLYCGDKWEVKISRGSSSASDISNSVANTSRAPEQFSNVFEAVRVLRALSKSCRACVEARRNAASHSLAEIPHDSLDLFRNNLLAFLFENGRLLRGAHWVNIARALMYFPVEHSDLRRLAPLCPTIEQEVQQAYQGRASIESVTSANQHVQRYPVNCETVAAAAVRHVFDYVEHRAAIATAPGGHLSPEFPFDLAYTDLVKLLPILEQIASSSSSPASALRPAVSNAHVVTALHYTCANAQHLHLDDFVKVLQTIRRLPPSAEVTAAIEMITAVVGDRLTETSPPNVLQQVPFRVIIKLAAALSALRVTRCDGFVAFIRGGVAFFPRMLTVETTLVFANALANMANERSTSCHDAMRALLARLLRGCEAELQAAPLVCAHPHEVTKILRACVLLDYIPEVHLLERLLGSEKVPLVLTPEVHAAGGALVFGLTRSMVHFLKQARGECPERVAELRTQGVLRTLLPMAVSCTRHLEAQVGAKWQGNASLYTAVSWRTTLEMICGFVDPNCDHNTPEETARCILDAFPLCAELLTSAAVLTRMQIAHLVQGSPTVADLRQRMQRTSFNANCSLHLLSSLLMLEYLVYQVAAQTSSMRARALPEDVSVRLKTLRDTAYTTFLNTPLPGDASADTVMDVVRSIFTCHVAGTAATAASPSTAILLNRRDVMEITTNLPFALSLIMHPGPVNEFFTDHCMSLIVSEDAE